MYNMCNFKRSIAETLSVSIPCSVYIDKVKHLDMYIVKLGTPYQNLYFGVTQGHAYSDCQRSICTKPDKNVLIDKYVYLLIVICLEIVVRNENTTLRLLLFVLHLFYYFSSSWCRFDEAHISNSYFTAYVLLLVADNTCTNFVFFHDVPRCLHRGNQVSSIINNVLQSIN